VPAADLSVPNPVGFGHFFERRVLMLRFTNLANIQRIFTLFLLLVTLSVTAFVANAQKARLSLEGDDKGPVLQEYRGISIGMLADDVRKKLGSPSDKAEEQDFFVINDNETAQIVYDKTHKVVTISFDFTSKASDVPTPKLVFGTDIDPKPDGSMYKMVRYPKVGYWLSYNRTAGDSPLTSITFQKIN
jgi:hypothetical protein